MPGGLFLHHFFSDQCETYYTVQGKTNIYSPHVRNIVLKMRVVILKCLQISQGCSWFSDFYSQSFLVSI